ncbi:HEPN domain-containing protein [Salegentibacter sp. UBA1130]|uniref:HEPN domain-containing protein n=1 Tax=Salegentibacter sp. UBA1130 TaxID=1947451 RepID=UPI00257B2586|nr:HEPN domain-containing protein [Salegentibacter sp. UBA1130]
MHYRIRNQISSLDALFDTAENLTDEEIQGHFAKYLCVKTSGLFESFIKSQIGDFADSTSAQPIAKHVKAKNKNFTNIDYRKLDGFLNSFSPDWWQKFEGKLTPDLKSSLNSVISNRNNIAHGNPDSITFGNMKTHYSNMKKIIELLDSIIIR